MVATAQPLRYSDDESRSLTRSVTARTNDGASLARAEAAVRTRRHRLDRPRRSRRTVWALVGDITTPSRHCQETVGAAWDSADRPAVGSSFKGRNATDDTGHPLIDAAVMLLVGKMKWETPCTVTVWEPGR